MNKGWVVVLCLMTMPLMFMLHWHRRDHRDGEPPSLPTVAHDLSLLEEISADVSLPVEWGPWERMCSVDAMHIRFEWTDEDRHLLVVRPWRTHTWRVVDDGDEVQKKRCRHT